MRARAQIIGMIAACYAERRAEVCAGGCSAHLCAGTTPSPVHPHPPRCRSAARLIHPSSQPPPPAPAGRRILSGTSLVAVLTTACISTATFAANGCIDLPASLLIAPPAVLLAPLGARFTSRLNCNALKRLLGWFLVVAAPLVPLKAYMFASRAEQLAAAGAAGAADAAGAAAADAAGDAAAVSAAASSPAEAPSSSSSGSGDSDAGSQLGSWEAQLQRLRGSMPSPLRAAALVATGGLSGFVSGLLGVGGGTTGGLLPRMLQLVWCWVVLCGGEECKACMHYARALQQTCSNIPPLPPCLLKPRWLH